tara:strand:+ start:336 stop:734 length:399 start_codon:yes stop_codon:yes gene_type:complete
MDYVDDCRDKPFDWNGFECLSFANGAAKVMTGKGFADDWVSEYKCACTAAKTYKAKLKAANRQSIIEGIDDRLKRSTGKLPMRGDIVARKDKSMKVIGVSLGVSISDLVAFVSRNGIVFDQSRKGDIFWVVQ